MNTTNAIVSGLSGRTVVGKCESCHRPLKVKTKAIKALMSLTCKCGKKNLIKDHVAELISNRAWNEVSELGGIAMDALVSALRAEDEVTRIKAAELLGGAGDPAATIHLLLVRGSSDVERAATEALVKIGKPTVISLIEALEHDYGYRAAEALGRIGDVRAVGPLINMIKYRQRQEAAHALNLLTGLDLGLRADDWERWWSSLSKRDRWLPILTGFTIPISIEHSTPTKTESSKHPRREQAPEAIEERVGFYTWREGTHEVGLEQVLAGLPETPAADGVTIGNGYVKVASLTPMGRSRTETYSPIDEQRWRYTIFEEFD